MRDRAARFWVVATLAAVVAGCGGEANPDGGAELDAARGDAGADADVEPTDAGSDAGPPDPSGEMALSWVRQISSPQTLGISAEARLAPGLSDGVVVSVTLGGASAAFADATPEALTVGDATTSISQAVGWFAADGTLESARLVATADASNFSAIGYAFGAFEDGSTVSGGRFVSNGLFGGVDPARVALSTTVEMPEPDVTLTSAEGYLGYFDAARRITRAQAIDSGSGSDDHRVLDLVALPDGSTLVAGTLFGDATLAPGAVLGTSPGVDSAETFFARFAADGSLDFAARLAGPSEPTRVAAFADGSFAALVRHTDALTLGPGEAQERTLPPPPDGTQAWDAVARFDADGRLRWARPFGSDATTYPGWRDLRTHADGSLTVSGTFRGMVSWPDEGAVDPVPIFGVDGVLARLDDDGALRWQTRIRPLRDLLIQAVEARDGESTWVLATIGAAGAGFETADGAVLDLPESTINARLVLLRYDGDGLLRAAQLLASTDCDGDDLLAAPGGDLFIAGRYGAGTELEPGTSDAIQLPDALASRNQFVARYRPR